MVFLAKFLFFVGDDRVWRGVVSLVAPPPPISLFLRGKTFVVFVPPVGGFCGGVKTHTRRSVVRGMCVCTCAVVVLARKRRRFVIVMIQVAARHSDVAC